MKLKTLLQSGVVTLEGVEHKIENGFIEAEQSMVGVLKSHGIIEPDPPPAAAQGAAAPAPTGDQVSVPRATLMTALKQLGIVTADNLPADTLVTALTEAASKQADRFKFEIDAAEKRGRDASADELKAALARATEAESHLEQLTAPKPADPAPVTAAAPVAQSAQPAPTAAPSA